MKQQALCFYQITNLKALAFLLPLLTILKKNLSMGSISQSILATLVLLPFTFGTANINITTNLHKHEIRIFLQNPKYA